MEVSNKIIRAAIADDKIKVISFDVFDTLLVRPFWEPDDLFFFLEREMTSLLSAGDIVRFSELRKDAERKARTRAVTKGIEEVTLVEIYNILKEENIFPQDFIDILMKKEMELESRFCYARQSAMKLMEYAASIGKRVIAVSDMYLPGTFIKSLLEKNGFLELEQVFVSSDIGFSKRTGHLYQHVLNTLNIKNEQILHIGDNIVSDVEIPRKLGLKAFPYYRAVDLLKGKYPNICAGNAFQYAFKQLRSPFPNSHSLDKLGNRCVLAVAANSAYDDPYRDYNKNGDYANDELLFGTFALGLYSLAQAYWVQESTSESIYDKVLFFSRDGYLPYLGFQLLQNLKKKEKPYYVRISRKAVLPLILSNESRLLCAGSYVNYRHHSPKSLTKLLLTVLREDTSKVLSEKLADKWNNGFTSETEMMQFLKLLFHFYVDNDKMELVVEGFQNYFKPFMSGNILTYDVGYNIKNEIMLNSFFPDVKITAAFTHSTNDLPLIRSKLTGIRIKQFYSSAPYVSWLPRELFLTENAPSCVGYSSKGEVIMEKIESNQGLVQRVQQHAISLMEDFTSIFKEDTFWLPIEPTDLCLPLESFLHSPTKKDIEWVKALKADNSADSGLHVFEGQKFWHTLRYQYWIASNHPGKVKYDLMRAWNLLQWDRPALRRAVKRKIKHYLYKI